MWYANYEKKYGKQDIVSTDITNDFIKIIRRFCKMSREVVIVAYGRSAVCKSRKGSFAGTHPIEYSAQVLKGVLDKVPQLDRSEIEDVIMGCAVQHGTTSMNIAKSVCARAELPECVAGHTINRFCSSGLQAIATGANAIA